MPITASLIGAGASIYSANKAAKASNKAAEQALALQREQYQQARTDMQPYMQAGQAGVNALQQRLLGGASGAADPGAFGNVGNPTYAQTAYQAPAAFNYGADDYTPSPESPRQSYRLRHNLIALRARRVDPRPVTKGRRRRVRHGPNLRPR